MIMQVGDDEAVETPLILAELPMMAMSNAGDEGQRLIEASPDERKPPASGAARV